MTTTQPSEWFGMDLVRALPGAAPEGEPDIAKRVEAVLGTTAQDPRYEQGIWQPTPLGETIACSLVALLVRAAPPDKGLAAYTACEDDDALDRVMAAMQRAVVRELRKVVAA